MTVVKKTSFRSNDSDSPHCCQAWIIQLYLQGGARICPCLIHDFLGPRECFPYNG